MAHETIRKLQALLIIAMLAVAEGQHVQNKANFPSTLKSSRSSRGNRDGQQATEAMGSQVPLDLLRIELDTLLKDPTFHKQLETMAEHMETFAKRLIKDLASHSPKTMARAIAMTAEMLTLPDEESSYVDSMLPEKMEAMIADRVFQEQAQLVAEDMQKHVVTDPDFVALLAESVPSAEKHPKVAFPDPGSSRQEEQTSQALQSLMSDPDLQSEAEAIAFNVTQMKDADAGHNMEQQISEQVNAVLASPKLREKASDVVQEILSSDLLGDFSQFARAIENPTRIKFGDEFLEKEDMEELADAVRSAESGQPTKLVETMEEVQRAKTKELSPPLELSPFSQAIAYFPIAMIPQRRKAIPFGGVPADFLRARGSMHAFIGGSALTPAKGALTSANGIRSMMPALRKVLSRRGGAVMSSDGTPKKGGAKVPLLLCFALWYLGNYYYQFTSAIALTVGGFYGGFPMTIATLQLGVGVIYALFTWLASETDGQRPQISFKDYVKTLPVGAMSAGAHAASFLALGAGSVSFAQVIKASEPAFTAVIGTLAYSSKLSRAKWLSLIPVIGGVCLASLGELNFAMGAVVTASIANIFAAVKGNENAKLMKTPGLSDRIGSVSNQFAITTVNAFLFMLPVMLLTEGPRLPQFIALLKGSPYLADNLIGSGVFLYFYNEIAAFTIKKTDAVTQSVANTAKRVIVMVVMALVMKESLTLLKLIGSGIGIGGVFLYSIIDKLVAARKGRKDQRGGTPEVFTV